MVGFFNIYLPSLHNKPLSHGLAIEITEPFFKTLNISIKKFSKSRICSNVWILLFYQNNYLQT